MLREDDILALLGDGNVSDIGELDSGDESEDFFPEAELTELLNEFENNDGNFENENEYNVVGKTFETTKKCDIRWARKPFAQPRLHLENLDQPIYPILLRSPLEYFSEYFNNDIFEKMAFFTNLYAVSKQISRFKPTNINEMKIFIGIHIIMGSLKYPRVRLYWEDNFQINIIARNMTRDRFFALRTNFHIIDNNSISKENKDKFIKVRPLFDAVLKKCNSLPLEQDLCVDEQMVPFKGQLSIKQYMKGKPIKWGVKIFLLCGGKSGMAYNFMLFQGYSELDSNLVKSVGSGGSVVLHLTQNVPPNRHFLYFDNYFSSFGLFERLQQLNIYAVGTIRSNWFAQPPFLSDKQMRKMGRGTAFEVTTDMNHCNIGLVKWFDNKAVTLGSNYVTSGDVDKVERWDKKKKAYVEIERPEIVRRYNDSMGGVDKMDQLISYYRILIRSRKWTLRMAMHAFDIAITNSWIQYTKEAEQLNIPKKNVLDLLHFRINLAKDLITFEKPITPKRKGRPLSTPSNESVNEPSQTYKIPKVDSQRPTEAVRTDTIDHLPEFDDRKYATKCKNKKCEGRRTHVYCLKCNVHLCLDKKSNCFKDFHVNK